MSLTAPLKWHGGKSYLARRIVALMPRHLHYVEPFAGGLAVLLERDPNDRRLWVSEDANRGGVSEVVNDLNKELVNFWRVLREPEYFHEFHRRAQATPLSRVEFNDARDAHEFFGPIDRALKFFIVCRQSRAGTFKGFTSLTRSRTRRGINGNASEWLGAVEGLPAVHARLLPVVVECMDAVELIRREDTPDTLFYCDPPYLHETRATTDAYAHEMTTEQHAELLGVLSNLKGKFMLSGYHSPLYDDEAAVHGWRLYEFDLPNHAAGGDSKRRMVECLWVNW
jgi:DNA adenine methylase